MDLGRQDVAFAPRGDVRMSGRLCVGCGRSFATDCAVCHAGTVTPASGGCRTFGVPGALLDRRAMVDAVLDAVLLHLRTFGGRALPGEASP